MHLVKAYPTGTRNELYMADFSTRTIGIGRASTLLEHFDVVHTQDTGGYAGKANPGPGTSMLAGQAQTQSVGKTSRHGMCLQIHLARTGPAFLDERTA
jgi:hypothetical protein